jgi:hypothetical protein
MFGINLRVLRFFMGGVFAIASLLCIIVAFWLVQRTFQIQLHLAFSHPLALLLDAVLPVSAAVYGTAGWTIWKEKSSARGWGIAASILQIIPPLWFMIVRSRSFWSCHGEVLAIGIFGLIVFSWPYKKESYLDDLENCEADIDDIEPEDDLT